MSQLPPSENSILYVVRCTFSPGSASIAERWLTWLRERHLAEVLAAGAVSAEVVRIQGTAEIYEVHYRFGCMQDFERYEQFEAPKLRADGLNRFPLTLGLQYERRVGQQLFALNSSNHRQGGLLGRGDESLSQSDG